MTDPNAARRSPSWARLGATLGAACSISLGAAAWAQSSSGGKSAAPKSKGQATSGAGGSKAMPAPQGQKPQAPRPQQSGATRVEFSDNSITLDEIGLTIPIAAGSVGQRDRVGGTSQITLMPEDASWRIVVRAPKTLDDDVTATVWCDKALQALLDSYATVAPFGEGQKMAGEKKLPGGARVLERTPNAKDPKQRVIDMGTQKVAVERFYALLPQGQGKPGTARGFTVFQVAPKQFVTFDLTCTEPDLARVRPIYEMTVAGSSLLPPDAVGLSRGVAVEAGRRVLDSLNPEDFAAIVAQRPERWYRHSIPSPTGDSNDATELGYTRVRFKMGSRGELDPAKPRAKWTTADMERGAIALIDLRRLDKGMVVDSTAAYFMDQSREREYWTVKTAVREPGKPVATAGEVGAREGKSMQVAVRADGTPEETIKPLFQGDSYVSRVDAFLLPQLLIRGKASAEFAFHTWVSSSRRITLRRDSLEQPADSPGVWRITTRFGEDAQPQVSLYRASGDLISTTMPDGSITEPIDLTDLIALWKRKGLPLE